MSQMSVSLRSRFRRIIPVPMIFLLIQHRLNTSNLPSLPSLDHTWFDMSGLE